MGVLWAHLVKLLPEYEVVSAPVEHDRHELVDAAAEETDRATHTHA